MRLSIPELIDKKIIPEKYSYEGKNLSPSIELTRIPAKTKWLGVTMEDMGAGNGGWVHWLVFNIPIGNTIREGYIPGVFGKNSWGKCEYGGPVCDPDKAHRYTFTVFALSSPLNLVEGISKETFESAIKGRVLAKAKAVGIYGARPKNTSDDLGAGEAGETNGVSTKSIKAARRKAGWKEELHFANYNNTDTWREASYPPVRFSWSALFDLSCLFPWLKRRD